MSNKNEKLMDLLVKNKTNFFQLVFNINLAILMFEYLSEFGEYEILRAWCDKLAL